MVGNGVHIYFNNRIMYSYSMDSVNYIYKLHYIELFNSINFFLRDENQNIFVTPDSDWLKSINIIIDSVMLIFGVSRKFQRKVLTLLA
ncbi:hypothetical protein RclHR1_02560005 [Rhizophagus clarus]|uniref:Uncharacterized protein n=1 Tax=Rhizophagus clarus TaxID=94130 RepID=A0A2Z6R0T5_9GLOM|nr:hypothetical protein RclHR1_02560005 [Rhizophagus clarus]